MKKKRVLTTEYAKYRETKLKYSKEYYQKHKEEKREYDRIRGDNLLRVKLSKLKRKCCVCGNLIRFRKDNIFAKTCSEKCSNINKNNLSSELIKRKYEYNSIKGLCVGCGLKKIIYSGYSTQIYCEDCHKEHLSRTRQYAQVIEHRFELTECVVCGIDITDRLSKAKYCLACAKKLRELYYKYGIRAKEGVLILTTNSSIPPTDKSVGILEAIL